MSDASNPSVVSQARTPEGLTAGVYANGILAWFVETDLTLDFFVNLPWEHGTGPEGDPAIIAPQQVVARVKIPPSMAIHVAKNLADAITAYEERYGAIPTLKDQPPFIPPSMDDGEGNAN